MERCEEGDKHCIPSCVGAGQESTIEGIFCPCCEIGKVSVRFQEVEMDGGVQLEESGMLQR